MRVAIIDDISRCREDIREYLLRYMKENYAAETVSIEDYTSGQAFLSDFMPDTYDIIFIDQYMDGLSGIDTALEIRKLDKLAALIFVTTSRDHAIDSFTVQACGYLVKPYGYDNFAKTMETARLDKIWGARFIRIEQEKILLNEILWCDQDNHYVQIHTDKCGLYRFRLSFKSLTGLLAPYPQFLTCYKGCIVNLERVECIIRFDFLMDNGNIVPFSQRDKKKIESLYHSFIFQRERKGMLL